MIPLLGFMPDADPTRPGVITDCTNFVPSASGGMMSSQTASTDPADIPLNARGVLPSPFIASSNIIYVGTSAGLYSVTVLTGGSTDLSRGGGYSLAASERWSIAQYRGNVLAVTPSAVVQRSTGGAFANVSGSPQAKIVVVSSGFAIALNTSTATDLWYCCAQFDETDWTINVGTQCTSGRLDGAPGPITAGARFGDDVVAFKANALFVGRYVGAPAVWQWTRVSEAVGCVGQNAVAETPMGLAFVGEDDIYLFDGTVPRPIGGFVRNWFFADRHISYLDRTYCAYDKTNGLLWIAYIRSGSGNEQRLDGRIAWHVATNRWGVAHSDASAIFAMDGVFGGVSIGWFGFHASSGVDLLYYNGAGASGSITTGDFGDDDTTTMCRALRVRYTSPPTASSVTGYFKAAADAALSTGTTSSVSDGRHNLRQTGRWHRFKIETTLTAAAPCEMVSVRPELIPAGRR